MVTLFPKSEKSRGPFVTQKGEVECSGCSGICEERPQFKQFFTKNQQEEARWQMLFHCAKCKRDYIIIAYEAVLEVQ